MAINLTIFILLRDEAKVVFGLNVLFFEGYYWQVLSSMFLHSGWTHVILNMLVLFQFGTILEKYLGSFRFCILYLCGGLACSLLSAFYIYFEALYFGRIYNTVGASGAICVLMGFYAFVDKSSTKGLIVALLLISFVPIFMGVNIAWYSHIFGFICGYMCAKFKLLKGKIR
ncbi:rhomboid family intramembrane serine protease [Campylobacter sp. MIT 99-7217]|uniref:rhomboid family intramembrane serine protease n=1 Tax=Campylobacter sp. MIT 99-7217 TaxID=535091 RepID=UPI003918187E